MPGLEHVFWIGGGSGAGKSTVARRLAATHGLPVYATDDVMPVDARRSTAQDCPHLHAFMAMDMDERWVRRSPEVMLDTFHWFRGEGFGLIVDDLRARRVSASASEACLPSDCKTPPPGGRFCNLMAKAAAVSEAVLSVGERSGGACRAVRATRR